LETTSTTGTTKLLHAAAVAVAVAAVLCFTLMRFDGDVAEPAIEITQAMETGPQYLYYAPGA
jgi:uncharacterized tellurite resistance protein B-like protein